MEPSHEGYCRWLSHFFFAPGYDPEDIYQEARIAMWLAPGHERTAARRQCLDIVKVANRKALFVELRDDDAATDDLAEKVEFRERLRAVLSATLTVNERIALGRVVRGEAIVRSEKALQVALWRARRRLADAGA